MARDSFQRCAGKVGGDNVELCVVWSAKRSFHNDSIPLSFALQSELGKLQHIATRGAGVSKAEREKVCQAANNAISVLQLGYKSENMTGVPATFSSHATFKRQRVVEIFAMDAEHSEGDEGGDDEHSPGETPINESDDTAEELEEVATHHANSTVRQVEETEFGTGSCTAAMSSDDDASSCPDSISVVTTIAWEKANRCTKCCSSRRYVVKRNRRGYSRA